MTYRCEAQSPEVVVQLIAASYLRHGFYWYVTGAIPEGKDPATIDQKLIAKYGIDVSEWERRHRRQRGIANAHYLRYQRWFILMLSEGHHALKQPSANGGEGEHLRDCRRTPIRFDGYSVSYRRSGVTPAGGPVAKWHAHVRIDDTTYRRLRDRFVDLAVHRTADTLSLFQIATSTLFSLRVNAGLFAIMFSPFSRLFVFHSLKGASRWKTNNFQGRRASLGVPEKAKTAQRVQGHDRLHSRLARRCSKRPQEPRKASVKTANEPFTLQTQDRVAWKTERNQQTMGITIPVLLLHRGMSVSYGCMAELLVVALLDTLSQAGALGGSVNWEDA